VGGIYPDGRGVQGLLANFFCLFRPLLPAFWQERENCTRNGGNLRTLRTDKPPCTRCFAGENFAVDASSALQDGLLRQNLKKAERLAYRSTAGSGRIRWHGVPGHGIGRP
jgi:hypothetical protein